MSCTPHIRSLTRFPDQILREIFRVELLVMATAYSQLLQHYAASRNAVSACQFFGWVLDEDPAAKSWLEYAPLDGDDCF